MRRISILGAAAFSSVYVAQAELPEYSYCGDESNPHIRVFESCGFAFSQARRTRISLFLSRENPQTR
jgi:hypothetical protein